MSKSFAKVMLMGNLTNDPQLKITANGQKVVTFVVATNRQWISNGEKMTQTEFTPISGWGSLAEISNNYLKKGKYVYIEGYLKTLTWTTDDGCRQSKTEVVMKDLIMLNPREKDQHDSIGSTEESSMTTKKTDTDDDFFNPEETGEEKEKSAS